MQAGDRWDLTGDGSCAAGVALGLLLTGLGSGLLAHAAERQDLRLVRRFLRPAVALWAAQLASLAAYVFILRSLTPATAAAWGGWATIAYALATFFAMPLAAWSAVGGAVLALWAVGRKAARDPS